MTAVIVMWLVVAALAIGVPRWMLWRQSRAVARVVAEYKTERERMQQERKVLNEQPRDLRQVPRN